MKKLLYLVTIPLFICICYSCSTDVDRKEKEVSYEVVKPYKAGTAPVKLVVKLSDKEITLADSVIFVIEIVVKKGGKAELPETVDLDFGGLEIADVYNVPLRVDDEGNEVKGLKYRLTPLISGEYKIKPFKVKYYVDGDVAEDGKTLKEYNLSTDEITITVTSITDEKSQSLAVRGIQGPVNLEYHIDKLTVIIISSGMFVVLGLTMYYIFFYRRRKKIAVSRMVPAHVIAYEDMMKLKKLNLIEQGKIKEFYYIMSEVLRKYIENRFNINAPDLTTEEFLEKISLFHLLSDKQKGILKNFMEHCDLVKYAKLIPEDNDIQKVINTAMSFIEETKSEEVKIGV